MTTAIEHAVYAIAKTRDRYRAAGLIADAERAQARLEIQLNQTDDPAKTLADLIARLERSDAFRS